MKCPNCNNELRTFNNFYLWSHPFTYKCKTCDSQLKPSHHIKRMFLLEVLLALVCLTLIEGTIGILTITGVLVFIVSTIVIFYPLEQYGYKNGFYTIKE